MADLLRPIEEEKIALSERATRARARVAETTAPPALAAIFDLQGADGCGNCRHWMQRSPLSVIGDCKPKRWLTSFAAKCAQHQHPGELYG